MGITVHGNQNAGVINNVEGTQNVYGSQHGTVTIDDVRAAARALSEAVDAEPMTDDARRTARDHVHAVEDEVARPEPDRRRVADRLSGLAKVLASAGAVVSAGSALLGPLHTLAAWLGPLAAPLLAVLPL